MNILESAINIVAPHSCLVCGDEGSLVCAWCLPEVAPVLPSRCYRCLKLTVDNKVCVACRRVSPLQRVWVRTNYDGAAKALVQRLKFGRAKLAAGIMAELIVESLPFLTDVVVVHVPTASSRVRLRGYDQAKLVARALAAKQNLAYKPWLARLGQSRQVGAKRAERVKQLEHAFRPTKPEEIQGKHILLVDDVLTTGATIEAAARTLKQAGAKSVSAIVFAQKQL